MPDIITPAQPEGPDKPTWWSIYQASLTRAGLTSTALQVVNVDSEYLVESGLYGDGDPTVDDAGWPQTRLRTGVVVGAVQSGKTASLLALVAKALDRGVNITVVLSGTRLSLWQQTVERAVDQLTRPNRVGNIQSGSDWVFLPDPEAILSGKPISLDDLLGIHPNRLVRALRLGTPLVCFALKQGDHLGKLGRLLADVTDRSMASSSKPLQMLVIDDEADDGSVLDAEVEASLAPESLQRKQLPRHIARLWASPQSGLETRHPRLYVNYVAYTATPQANILQSDHNPLSPRHFMAALRTPGATGATLGTRTEHYREPSGLHSFYTGGEYFYAGRPGLPRLCVNVPGGVGLTQQRGAAVPRGNLDWVAQNIAGAVRSFLVATAIRIEESGRRYSNVHGKAFSSPEEAFAASPAPASMLIHPAAATSYHQLVAEAVAAWSLGPLTEEEQERSCPRNESGSPVMSVDGLRQHLASDSAAWAAAFEAFAASAREIEALYPQAPQLPHSGVTWESIKGFLETDVLPALTLAIINSDPTTDDRPRFRPVRDESSTWTCAPHLCTIFVAGNIMSRGLTLEGLTCTAFLRDVTVPVADTQMQMQRWYGYRGKHLSLCRVYLDRDQEAHFSAYHNDDRALRTQILTAMNENEGRVTRPLVLQGSEYKATAKIANLSSLPLCPGAYPFVRALPDGEHAQSAISQLERIVAEGVWRPLSIAGRTRGVLREGPMSMLAVAAFLEGLTSSYHIPDPNSRLNFRWRALERSGGLGASDRPLFRVPSPSSAFQQGVSPLACQYSIAAYLRLWDAALRHELPGLFPTDDRTRPWCLIDRLDYAATAPQFNVGIRFGQEGPSESKILRDIGVGLSHRATNNGVLRSTWGTRNPSAVPGSYLGDQYFDYHAGTRSAPQRIGDAEPWRPRGDPGLLLIHVLKTLGGETLAVGLAIPLGGPDHFAAITSIA